MKKRREPFVVVLLTTGALLGSVGCTDARTSVNPPEPEADAGVPDGSSNPPPPDASIPDAAPERPDADLILPDAQAE
tara:strand:- start:59931 stop:60161 length:231 start_codon:yes stop_codon:yes gene_type:complete